GDLSGWSGDTSNAEVLTGFSGTGATWSPQDGSYFLKLSDNNSILEQTGVVNAGQILSGWVGLEGDSVLQCFFGLDSKSASVTVRDSVGTVIATPGEVTAIAPGCAGPILWTDWSWIAPISGTYTVSFEVSEVTGGVRGFFDGIEISAIPEPTTLLLMGLGLAGIGYRRKKTA
ncbi:MAG: PEP-CTERM sorting domain-containing protein, partial [Gammaproteobacteria bacterium]|nr:PEP-CTERM sorting domain-containing protein [Gammaproteobacteria bacterium]